MSAKINPYLSILGYHGPNILLVLILLTLAFQSQHYITPYIYLVVIGWQFISHLINVVIKNTIQAPRPDSKHTADSNDTDFEKLKPTLSNYMSIHVNYGMPSGHAQAVCSELVFIALYFQKPILTFFAVAQTAITLWQRYVSHRHSLLQLAVGGTIGAGVGLIFYRIFEKIVPRR